MHIINDKGSTLSKVFDLYSDWHVTLIDACYFGRTGLQTALLNTVNFSTLKVRSFSSLIGQISAMPPLIDVDEDIRTGKKCGGCLVVRLPSLPQEAIAMLLSLGSIPLNMYTHVVLLSHIEPDFIRRMLLGVGVNRPICILDDRLSISVLCHAIIPPASGLPLPTNWFGERLQTQLPSLFTLGELRALWYVANGIPIHQQMRHSHLSNKTLYSQRYTALMKLKVRGVNELMRNFFSRRVRLKSA